jgi:hypothetical protein
MIRAVPLAIVLLLFGCGPSVPPEALGPPEPIPLPPPRDAGSATDLAAAPAKLRAEHDRVIPREKAVVATSDADAIAKVHELDRNVQQALDDLERDGGRHITPKAVKRAQVAIGALQKTLSEVEAHGP